MVWAQTPSSGEERGSGPRPNATRGGGREEWQWWGEGEETSGPGPDTSVGRKEGKSGPGPDTAGVEEQGQTPSAGCREARGGAGPHKGRGRHRALPPPPSPPPVSLDGQFGKSFIFIFLGLLFVSNFPY